MLRRFSSYDLEALFALMPIDENFINVVYKDITPGHDLMTEMTA